MTLSTNRYKVALIACIVGHLTLAIKQSSFSSFAKCITDIAGGVSIEQERLELVVTSDIIGD